jgi:hypothetical protein
MRLKDAPKKIVVANATWNQLTTADEISHLEKAIPEPSPGYLPNDIMNPIRNDNTSDIVQFPGNSGLGIHHHQVGCSPTCSAVQPLHGSLSECLQLRLSCAKREAPKS